MSSQSQRPKGFGTKHKGLLLAVVAVVGLFGVSPANPLPPLWTPIFGGGSCPCYGFMNEGPAFGYDADTQVYTARSRHFFNLGIPGFGPGDLTFGEAVVDRTGHVLRGGLVQWIGAIPALGIPDGTLLFRGRITAVTIINLGPFGGELPVDPFLEILINAEFSHPAVGLAATVGYVALVPGVTPIPTDFDEFFEDPFAASFILGTTSTQVLFNISGLPEPVAIDIKPGGNPNTVNPRSKGTIPVAILTTDAFDATTVDPVTVGFGPNAAGIGQRSIGIEDVDGDGDLDLVLRFPTPETGIACGDTETPLSGTTFDGSQIAGFDRIVTVGCNE